MTFSTCGSEVWPVRRQPAGGSRPVRNRRVDAAVSSVVSRSDSHNNAHAPPFVTARTAACPTVARLGIYSSGDPHESTIQELRDRRRKAHRLQRGPACRCRRTRGVGAARRRGPPGHRS